MKLIIQFLKFTVVGASNSAIYLGIFYLFTWASPGTYVAMVGQAVAWLISVTNSFIWNRKFVFTNSKSIWWHSLIRTYMGYGGGLLVSSLLTYVQLELLGVPQTIVPMVNLLAMGPVNFVIVKKFSFRDSIEQPANLLSES